MIFQATAYLLCMLVSIVIMCLLLRGHLRTRAPLLLWCALCFVGLAINNLLVVADMLLLPDLDLRPLRVAFHVGGLAILVYGFVFEADT